ncbi:uncharacterized protein LOC134202719 [Armigeres subalbatus]|uniref:uncharacterized protein LOC134202719 n=1 Tax=Armigeres subalbatus TaxID=124917 RepID=UPI002ED4546B
MRYYNCSRIKVRAKPQCTRQLLAFIPNTTGDVSVSAKGQHSCHEAPAENLARSKLATGDKQLIDKLVGSGIPSMHIKLQLQANNGNFAKGSLNYAVKSSREKLFGTGTMSFGELETWLSSRCAVPDDAREAFIIGKDVDHDNRKFRIIISSKRMLSYLCRFTTIAADCTFKITMQGYPLLVICIIDQMRKAHPVAFACITNQEQIDYTFVFQTLVSAAVNQGGDVRVANFLSDGELALKNAARCVFGQAVVLLNCYFHVKENIIKHFKSTPEMPIEVQEQLKREVALLQIAPTKRHFGAALSYL